ncbi:hypothetical protein [Caenispirillum salinarum]|uniref:hypothetical protein n=1 Tax=Caenispirillum salinarum TaxID=859058 RepID=UPI003851795B
MYAFAGLLTLLGLIGLVVGVIKPSLVVPGATKTRARAGAVYGAVLVMGAILSAATAPDVPAADAPKAADEKGGAAAVQTSQPVKANERSPADGEFAVDSEEAFKRYCQYDAANEEAVLAATRKIGANPHEALQPGDVVELEEESVISPAMDSDGTFEGSMALLAQLAHIPAGDTIEVLAREYDKGDDLTYRVHWVERDAVGFVRPVTLMWLSRDMDRIGEHMDQHEALVAERMAPLRKALFADAGVDVNDVVMQAITSGWPQRCP